MSKGISNWMTKAVFALFVLGLLFAGPSLVFAQQGPCEQYCTDVNTETKQAREQGREPNFSDINQPQGKTCICNPLQANTLGGIIDDVLTFLFNVALVLTPIMVIIAGILFVSAAGNPTQISRAKQMLIWTAVGFGVIVLARGLITVIRNILGF